MSRHRHEIVPGWVLIGFALFSMFILGSIFQYNLDLSRHEAGTFPPANTRWAEQGE